MALGLFLLTTAQGAATLVQSVTSANGGNDVSITATFTSTPTSGNLLVAILGTRGSSGTVTAPAGWTNAILGTASVPGQSIFYRIAGASEPLAVTFDVTNSGRLGLQLFEYTGIPNAVMMGSVLMNAGTGTSITSGTVTTTVADELLITAAVVNDNGGTSNTFDGWTGGFNEVNDLQNSGAASFRSNYAAADRIATVPGNYATSVNTVNSGSWIVQTVRFASGKNISGTVFEDLNYGGGAGRDRTTALAGGGSARPNARVELYNSAGSFVSSTVTNASGLYTFTSLQPGAYKVRVVNNSVGSARSGYMAGIDLGVQTFRTDVSSGIPNAVGNRVGGEAPERVDAGNGSTTLAALSTVTTTAQSITSVQLGTTDITGVDFGYNFDLVVNTNNAGQGSLRQFIINANDLGGEAALAQSGFRKDTLGVNEALPAGKETSIFMIPDGLAHAGMRSGTVNQLSGQGVAVINVAGLLPTITGANTVIDGTTQTVNVGNTNAAVLGTGGTVGVDALALPQVAGPEVELRDAAGLATGLVIAADDPGIRGMCLNGFGSTAPDASILLNAGVNAMIELNVIGTRAHTFTDPGPGARDFIGLCPYGALNGTIRRNLIGFTDLRAIWVANGSTGWKVNGNELRDNGLNSTSGDGIAINSASSSCTGNLITGTSSQGYVVTAAANNLFTNNTLIGNGVGLTTGHAESAAITMRPGASATTIDRNVIRSNYGAGIQVNNGASGTVITRNSIHSNGTITSRNALPATNQIGIDLDAPGNDGNLGTAPFVTLNDNGDPDTGGNGLLNFPVLNTATIQGTNLVVTGWARPGSVVEFFLRDSDPSGFGEGQTYLFSATEGSGGDTDASTGTYGPGAVNGLAQGTDNTNRFAFTVPLPGGAASGSKITATATLGGNTSEFSGSATVNSAPIAVCQNITANLNAGGSATITGAMVNNGSSDPDGTIASLSVSPNSFTCANTGANTVTLTVTDNLGATATCTATVTVVDNIPPAISCPANIVRNPDPGSCSANVTYTAPLGTDNCSGVTTTRIAGPASGSTFNPGVTTITYQATDAAGNSTTCSFTVTVNPGNDNDGDGICDNVDLDDDNDGIPDTAEGGDLLDTDGDGVPNRFDLDSDNDGIYDALEAGSGQPFTNGVLNGPVTAQGIPTAVDADANGMIDYTMKDSDADGNIDSLELDSDNDGCTDVIEAGFIDHNGDGELGNVPLTVNAQGIVTSTAP